MTTLAEAEAALEAAQLTYAHASVAAAETKAKAGGLRQQVASGKGADISPSDIAAADQAAEHAALVFEGASAALPALMAAVAAARADEVADEVVTALPQLGSAVLEALDNVASALAGLVTAAAEYDKLVEGSIRRLDKVHHGSPRVNFPRLSAPTVDRITLSSCRGASQLSRVILPAVQRLGAPTALVESLKNLAAGAPNLPGTES